MLESDVLLNVLYVFGTAKDFINTFTTIIKTCEKKHEKI